MFCQQLGTQRPVSWTKGVMRRPRLKPETPAQHAHAQLKVSGFLKPPVGESGRIENTSGYL